ncbi:DUF4003 domain-containing protein [Exiguobacterium sp. SH3S2]|nr:DUF4003 domain-containing protein [Exiguobacterium sp. SH3S3]TCI62290.1 DUF4003 domain-containing protein [Exiguobacterium sp. SH3S1]TCI62350.1 DUF4003 domain-containing protein [Exiguobacterium sp. SH3S2]
MREGGILMLTRYTRYLDSFEAIKTATKWALTDDFRRLMAVNYAIHDTPFDPNQFEQAQAAVKQKTGLFSKFRGSNNLVWLSFLDAKYEDVGPAIDEALRLDTLLDRKHFRFSALRPFLASQLINVDEPERRLDEASALYQAFKRQHPWLTSEEDLLSALVLVQAFDDHTELNERIESYYEALKAQLPRSNELQLVSHLLMFSKLDRDDAVARFLDWRTRLENQQLAVKSEQLPSLALLSIVSAPNDQDEQAILDITNAEKEQQRWFNTHGLNVAIQLVAAEHITEDASDLLLNGTFAHLLAMQQAASAAASVAIIASTSSSD